MTQKRLIQMHRMREPNTQRGAILIMSMTILLLMTVIGLASIRSSGVQMKMANNQQIRQKVFQAAELTLHDIEEEIILDGLGNEVLDRLQGCTVGDPDCYDSGCGGGLCFRGEYLVGDPENACQLFPTVAPSDPVDLLPYWKRPNFWDDANAAHYSRFPIPDSRVSSVKYIKEFMCYVNRDVSATCQASGGNECAALFRVTALAISQDERSKVMLQSTVRVMPE